MAHPVFFREKRKGPLEFHAPGPEYNFVVHSFFQINAVIGLVPDARPGLGGLQPHIVRVLLAVGAARDDAASHPVCRVRRIGAPGIAAVILHMIVAGIPRGFHALKGTVLHHLRVQPAVRRVIDVLEEQTYHALLYPCLFL